MNRVRHRRGMTILEASPRLGLGYRRAMSKYGRYVATDYDGRAHRARQTLDLERMPFASGSIDLLMCAHVLEHVPNTHRALAELHRVLAPDGDLLLQVPLYHTPTGPPPAPEVHADDTPVFWRFGSDLTDRLRDHRFDVAVLVPRDMHRHVAAMDLSWTPSLDPDFHGASIIAATTASDLEVLADDEVSDASWFQPSYMFSVWHARRTTAGG